MRSGACAICLNILVSSYMVKASTVSVFNWTHCSSPDSLIRVIWGVSLGTCAETCEKSQDCAQYNYRKRRTSCELLFEVGSTPATDSGCISGSSPMGTKQNEMCSQPDGEPVCFTHECVPLSVEYAFVHGNVLSEGSKVKIVCEFGNNMTTATCQDNGEWEPLPICPAGCRPLTVANAVVHNNVSFQEDTVWLKGSRVIISCLSDKPPTTATCHEHGEWAPLPTCPEVDGCPASLLEILTIGNQALIVCKTRMTQTDATNACQPYDGLIRIETKQQYDALKAELLSNTFVGHDYWIQGKYDTRDQRWEFDDGTPFGISDMITHNEPGGVCVRLRYVTYYDMHDRVCFKTFGYICTGKKI